MKPVSLRLKLAVWYFAVLALTFLAFTVLAWWVMRASLYGAVDADLYERVAGVRARLQRQPPAGASSDTVAAIGEHVGLDDALQIRLGSGAWIYRAPLIRHVPGLLLPAAAPGHTGPPASIRIDGRPFRAITTRVSSGGREYIVEVGARLQDADEALRRFRLAMLVAAPALLVVASAGGYWLSRRALGPVDEIARAARAITADSLSRRLTVPQTADELQRLSETLNEMLERLDTAFSRVTQFTADAAHELRTPVAVMRTVAEVALRRPRTEPELRAALAQVHGELERTCGVLDNLLQLARADAGAEQMQKAPMDLADSLRQASGRAAALAAAKGISLVGPCVAGGMAVNGDRALLDRLFLILVDNAVKYTQPGGRVDVCAATDGACAVAEVRDTGCGIAETDLPRIWERFYRCDEAHSGDSGGSGLGLAIAKWIVETHGGDISAESVVGRGSVFRVRLPLIAR